MYNSQLPSLNQLDDSFRVFKVPRDGPKSGQKIYTYLSMLCIWRFPKMWVPLIIIQVMDDHFIYFSIETHGDDWSLTSAAGNGSSFVVTQQHQTHGFSRASKNRGL